MRPEDRAKDETFRDRLKMCRRTRNMTRKEVRERSGISDAYLVMLENGTRKVPTLGLIKRLEQAVDCEPLFLVKAAYKEVEGINL